MLPREQTKQPPRPSGTERGEVWDTVVRQAAGVVTSPSFEEIKYPADGSPERAELLALMRGPTWRDRFGDTAFDEGYSLWCEKRFHEQSAKRPLRLAESPEHRSLDALISAWEAGLSKVITIPSRGEYTRVIGDTALLMTEATHTNPELYTEALGTFRKRFTTLDNRDLDALDCCHH